MIEPRWGRDFRTRPDTPWGPPSLLYNGYRVSFPRVKRPGVALTTYPHLALRLRKEYIYASVPFLGLFYGVKFTFFYLLYGSWPCCLLKCGFRSSTRWAHMVQCHLTFCNTFQPQKSKLHGLCMFETCTISVIIVKP
jgi:hypothetical protein